MPAAHADHERTAHSAFSGAGRQSSGCGIAEEALNRRAAHKRASPGRTLSRPAIEGILLLAEGGADACHLTLRAPGGIRSIALGDGGSLTRNPRTRAVRPGVLTRREEAIRGFLI